MPHSVDKSKRNARVINTEIGFRESAGRRGTENTICTVVATVEGGPSSINGDTDMVMCQKVDADREKAQKRAVAQIHKMVKEWNGGKTWRKNLK